MSATPKKKELKTGAISLEEIKPQVKEPERKGLYQWEEISKTLKKGQAYVLPMTAKKNSILTGLRREKLNGKIAVHKETGQMVILPQ